MELEELRKEIDKTDDEMVALFCHRMQTAGEIAAYKKEHNLPVLAAGREREKLADVASKAEKGMESYTRVLYSFLFELSRAYQEKLIGEESELSRSIGRALEETPKMFPRSAAVACQGVEGAYSQIACEKLFSAPSIQFFKSFEGVFSAVEAGLCRYGVIPIENSTAGSVKEVYDLMIRHDFRIIRSLRVKVDHCLLARKGVKKEALTEIVSHEQAISQCSEFLKTLRGVKITTVENTAVAAQTVAQSGRNDIAALSSRACGNLYGLTALETSVQNRDNNYTRFICISRKPEIYPGADRTSIMLVTPHKPGALYSVLSRFYALGINLLKLESRPIPERDFEFMFYFDLETSVYSEEFIQLLRELEESCEEFHYLGSYTEVV